MLHECVRCIVRGFLVAVGGLLLWHYILGPMLVYGIHRVVQILDDWFNGRR